MRLGINGWRIHGQRTGVGRYLLNVVKHWTADAVSGRFDEVNFYTPRAIDRREIPIPDNIHERVVGPDWRMLVWENLRLAPAANDDVLFCPSYSRPLAARSGTVVAVHDATLHLYPERFSLTARLVYDRLYGWSARHATAVVTATEAGRQDIIRSYGVPPARIRVIHLAPDEIFGRLPADDPRLAGARQRFIGSSAPFFLFVGKRSGRRNLPCLAKAFAELKRRGTLPHKLLLVGPDNEGSNLAVARAAGDMYKHVLSARYVSDPELNALYNAATALVMPSIYETVSLPVIEAQATGTPVISIDTPGAREMTGGAALLISRLEVSDLVDSMARIASDAAFCRELSEKGLTNARRFSWERCSMETLAILEETARRAAPGR